MKDGMREPGDEGALERADGGGGRETDDDARPPGPVVGRGDQLGAMNRADGGHVSRREVDLAEQQGEDLGQAEKDEHRRLHEKVDDVAGRQEGARWTWKMTTITTSPARIGQGPALAGPDPLPPGPE